MVQYEIAVIYDPGLEVDLDKATSKVEKIFKDAGVKVANIDNWGKRKLAYKIAGHDQGIYVFYTVELSSENVGKIEADFNLADEIIRFLIVKIDQKAIAKAEAAKAKQDKDAEDKEEKSEEE
ncbi:MAG TPA: 30S ribosomal protein S6 [Candidatus Saccharimonadales bacterium]|nr:30S ribosomal protein S6 [Candidatus Saccharimonadales bacterium]